MLAAALMLSLVYTSCDELEGLFDGDKESADQAFFPKSYEGKTVAAWYARTDKSDDKVKTTAVFLFTDKTFVVTKSKVYDDESKNERKIEAEGTYTFLEGDYDNGKAIAEVNDGGLMTIMIEKGKLTNVDVNEVFKKQDNNKVPKAQDPVDGDGGGQGGNHDDLNGAVEPFFPKAYADKTVTAWFVQYGNTWQEDSKIDYAASIFMFDDNTFVVTSNALIDGPSGMFQVRQISEGGRYAITNGDFISGTVELYFENGKVMKVSIDNGDLMTEDRKEYFKQDNGKVPAPSDPTENGGDQGGDSDYIGDVQPYLPAEFGGNTIGAWYLFVDEQDSKIQLESVFLFDDGSLVVTKSKFYTVADGREPEYAINATGKYRLTEGDYESGIASVVLSDGETFEVKISNGELFAMNTLFTKQKNESAPAPLKL